MPIEPNARYDVGMSDNRGSFGPDPEMKFFHVNGEPELFKTLAHCKLEVMMGNILFSASACKTL